MHKLIATILVGVSIFILIGCLDLSSDTAGKIRIGENIPSPQNTYIATTYIFEAGGAAGSCSKDVNIRKNDEIFDATKNNVFTTRCNSKIEVTWLDETSLNIGYSDEPLFNQAMQWNKVKISYYLIKTNK